MTYKPAVMDHKRSWTAHTTSKKLNGLKIQKLNVKIQPACLNSGPALAGSLYSLAIPLRCNISNSSVTAATESPVEGGGGGRREMAPLSFSVDISYSIANAATKLSRPLRASFLHLVTKFFQSSYERLVTNDVRGMPCSVISDSIKGLAGRAVTLTVLKITKNIQDQKDAK